MVSNEGGLSAQASGVPLFKQTPVQHTIAIRLVKASLKQILNNKNHNIFRKPDRLIENLPQICTNTHFAEEYTEDIETLSSTVLHYDKKEYSSRKKITHTHAHTQVCM